ncbi:MAG: DUF1360 domain-containing protein [Patescibacteria group bacterium]
MTKTSYTGWSATALIFYIILNALGLYYANPYFHINATNISWITLFILGLGVYRLTDIILYEKVTEPVRNIFIHEEHAKGQSSFQKFINQLFSCNSCFGVWIATLTVYAYLFFPIATFIIMLIMALTGLERLFSKVVNKLEK